MGEVTGIGWTDHTFNSWWGCEKVSPACDHCYAESTSKRYGFKIWGQDSERRFFGDKHWSEPLKWNEAAKRDGVRRRVFCASMADVMEDRWDLLAPRKRLRGLILDCECLDWLLLTKRPEGLAESAFHCGNVWAMTTVENQDYIHRAETLTNAGYFAVKGLSVEPMLGPVSLGPVLASRIDWVIVGAESGHGARETKLEWVLDLRDECQANGVKFFVKQLVIDGKLTKDITRFPADLQIQEFPK
jgi:protein gp37